MAQEPKTPVYVRLDPPVREALDEMAASDERARSEIIRRAVRLYLRENGPDRYARIVEAERAAGGRTTVPAPDEDALLNAYRELRDDQRKAALLRFARELLLRPELAELATWVIENTASTRGTPARGRSARSRVRGANLGPEE